METHSTHRKNKKPLLLEVNIIMFFSLSPRQLLQKFVNFLLASVSLYCNQNQMCSFLLQTLQLKTEETLQLLIHLCFSTGCWIFKGRVLSDLDTGSISHNSDPHSCPLPSHYVIWYSSCAGESCDLTWHHFITIWLNTSNNHQQQPPLLLQPHGSCGSKTRQP